MDRGQFPDAPPTLPGNRQRAWHLKDIVKLKFFAMMMDAGMPASDAGQFAKQLEIGMLKDPEARELGVWVKRHPKRKQAELLIRAEAPDDTELLMMLPVGEWRRSIRAELHDHWRAEQR